MRGMILGVAGLVADAVAIEPGWLKVRRVRMNRAPKHRFVHVTDIHHKGDAAFLERVVAAIKAEQPEFACFTGDLVEEARYAAEALAILGEAGCPLYGIPGNHDFWADMDFDAARETFAKSGGAWLMDEGATAAGGEIQLFGLSGVDFKHAGAPRVPQRTNILLSHYPEAADRLSGAAFDLILAGHSHGGQVRLPGVGALMVPSQVGAYELGLYQTPAGPLYVSSGIGYFFADIRLCCRPEIVVFEI